MATKFLSKVVDYGLLVQANWATPAAASAAFKTIPYNAGVTVFEPDVRVGSFNTTGQVGIHKEKERVHVDARSGLPKVNFSMPADVKTLLPHLAGALHNVSQGAPTAYDKTINCGGLTSPIDFNGNDFKVFTIALSNTSSGGSGSGDDGMILENAIIENLTLTWDFLADGTARLMQMSGNWIGNKMNFEQNVASSNWSTTTFTPMGNTDLMSLTTFTVDTQPWSSLNVRRFTFNVANNVTADSATTAGKANNYDTAPVYTSQILMDYNPTTEKAMKDFQDGATVVATIASSIVSGADGAFSIACTGGVLQRQPFAYNGEFVAVELDVLWHSTAGATPLTMTLTDSIDWGY